MLRAAPRANAVRASQLGSTAQKLQKFKQDSNKFKLGLPEDNALLSRVLKTIPQQVRLHPKGQYIHKAFIVLQQALNNSFRMLEDSAIVCNNICKYIQQCLILLIRKVENKKSISLSILDDLKDFQNQILLQKRELLSFTEATVGQMREVKLQSALSEQTCLLSGVISIIIQPQEERAFLQEHEEYLKQLFFIKQRASDTLMASNKAGEQVRIDERHLQDLDTQLNTVEKEIEMLKISEEMKLGNENQLDSQLAISRQTQDMLLLEDLKQRSIDYQNKQGEKIDEQQALLIELQMSIFRKYMDATSPISLQSRSVLLFSKDQKELANQKWDLANTINDVKMSILRGKQLQRKLITEAEVEKQVLQVKQSIKPLITPQMIAERKYELQKLVTRHGFSSVNALQEYQNEAEKCIYVERKILEIVRQVEESIFYAHQNVKQIGISLKNYELAQINAQEPNSLQLKAQFQQALQLPEKIDPALLTIKILETKMPFFGQRVNSLGEPEYFKDHFLSLLLTEELWPQVKELAYANYTDHKQDEKTFEGYTHIIFMKLYDTKDTKLMSKKQALRRISAEVKRIEEKIIKTEQKKEQNLKDLRDKLDQIQTKIDTEFKLKIIKAKGDQNKIQALLTAKASKQTPYFLKETLKSQNLDKKLDEEMGKLVERLEKAEDDRFEAQMEEITATKILFSEFKNEFDLIKTAFICIKAAVQDLSSMSSDLCANAFLEDLIENAIQNSSSILPQHRPDLALTQIDQALEEGNNKAC